MSSSRRPGDARARAGLLSMTACVALATSTARADDLPAAPMALAAAPTATPATPPGSATTVTPTTPAPTARPATPATPPAPTTAESATPATPPGPTTPAATPGPSTPGPAPAEQPATPPDTAAPASEPAPPGAAGTTASPDRPPLRAATRPPRVDGPYFGGTLGPGVSLARVNNFPTPDPLAGGTGSLRVGQAIYPWMTIGLEITGTFARRAADPSQRLLQGAALIDFGFLPVPRIPLSLHVGFGAGGGAVRQAGRSARSGFGGAVFTGAVRYEIFPLAARKRPRRGGGFSLGPELGWLGFLPAASGRPMSNTIYLGLFAGFYFGS